MLENPSILLTQNLHGVLPIILFFLKDIAKLHCLKDTINKERKKKEKLDALRLFICKEGIAGAGFHSAVILMRWVISHPCPYTTDKG